MKDKDLAVRLSDAICKHANAGHSDVNKMHRLGDVLARAVDWSHVPESFLPTLVAMRLAGTWLDSKVPGVQHLNHNSNLNNDDHQVSNCDQQMQDCDLKMLANILQFTSDVFNSPSRDLDLECIDQNTSVLRSYKQHVLWAGKMRLAVTEGFASESTLAKMLTSENDSIPLSFISFLSSRPTGRAAEAVQNSLLSGTPSESFKIFLPVTDEANRKSAAAGRLTHWLEQTVRNGSSDILKNTIQSLQNSIKVAKLTSFPECLGGDDFKKDSALQDAVRVFMDCAHPRIGNVGSDLIDREARHILNTYSDSGDPFEVPTQARKRTKMLIEQVLKGGKVSYDKVRLQTTLDDASFKREQRALVALLDADVSPQSIEQFLHLVEVDPSKLLGWASFGFFS